MTAPRPAGFPAGMVEFLRRAGIKETPQAMPGAGSSRRFWRAPSVVLSHTPDREEFHRILSLAPPLESAGLPLTRLIAKDAALHLLLHEDAGDVSLVRVIRDHGGPAFPASLPAALPSGPISDEAGAAIVSLVNVVTSVSSAERPPGLVDFGYEDLRWESWYGLTHQIWGRLQVPWSDLSVELNDLALMVGHGPRSIMHRDFQGTNLHRMPDGSFRVLDWGGARWGPATYDLVSLLWDPYLDLPDPLRATAVDAWLRAGGPGPRALIEATALQRLLQAAGAFAFLERHRARPAFAPFAAPALRAALPLAKPWPALTRVLAEASRRVAGFEPA